MEKKKEKIQKVNNIYFYFTSLTFTLLGNLVLLLQAADAQTVVLGVVQSQENQGVWQAMTTRSQPSEVASCNFDLSQVNKTAELSDHISSLPASTPAQQACQIALGQASPASVPIRQANTTTTAGQRLPDWREMPSPSQAQRLPIPTGAIAPANQPPDKLPDAKSSQLRIQPNPTPTDDKRWVQDAIENWQETPANPSSINRRPSASPLVPSANLPLSPVDDVPVAPAGLEVKPGSAPLTAVQVNSMRQELSNLIGRFESALLAQQAASSNLNLAANDKEQVAGVTNTEESKFSPQANSQIPLMTSGDRTLAQAKAGLVTFLQMVGKQNYSGARNQWLQTRQILWNNYPTDRKISTSEIRAIWLDRASIVNARSEQDLAKIFDQIASAGINTVFFETLNAGYPIYPSRILPVQNPLVRGWNPLKAAVKLAHERGMELHAWVWIFAAGNQKHNTLVNLPANYPGPIVAAHPDWAMLDNHGRLFHQPSGKVFLDPANPQVRRTLVDVLDEIASEYQVDGIQLDYIRYPFAGSGGNTTYGYGKAARQQFQQLTGVDPIAISPRDRDRASKWTEFRIKQIDSFVAMVSDRLHGKRPELILSAAVFPIPKQERLARLQQNWEEWAMRGDVDVVVPMTYALDTNRLQQITSPLLRGAALGSSLIVPSVRLLNLSDRVAVDQMQLLRDLPTGGYSLFAFENFSDRLHTILSRTQGTVMRSPNQPVPYRQPFYAAATRYAALQREWSFLLANNQLWIREPVLSEWRKRTDDLSVALNQLAANPSNSNLLSARALLTSFRSQSRKWMQLQAVQQPYQVQVWDNRLATVENLLLYGERAMWNRRNLSFSEQK